MSKIDIYTKVVASLRTSADYIKPLPLNESDSAPESANYVQFGPEVGYPCVFEPNFAKPSDYSRTQKLISAARENNIPLLSLPLGKDILFGGSRTATEMLSSLQSAALEFPASRAFREGYRNYATIETAMRDAGFEHSKFRAFVTEAGSYPETTRQTAVFCILIAEQLEIPLPQFIDFLKSPITTGGLKQDIPTVAELAFGKYTRSHLANWFHTPIVPMIFIKDEAGDPQFHPKFKDFLLDITDGKPGHCPVIGHSFGEEAPDIPGNIIPGLLSSFLEDYQTSLNTIASGDRHGETDILGIFNRENPLLKMVGKVLSRI